MSFAARLSRHPLPHDPDLGQEALAHLPGLRPEFVPLIEGTGGSSPYLGRLIASEAEWLAGVLEDTPEAAMEELIGAAEIADGPGLKTTLRGLKRRVALVTALADLGGVWDLAEVTGALTRFAEVSTRASLRVALREQAKRGRLPGISEDEAGDGAGMVVLAMGKMGAGELNYSSDIDLICLFDDSRFEPGDEMDARSGFVRATRAMAATLGEVTGDGYVFRTDLRLRPDAGATPVCVSMSAAERYYEAEGRTWERAAYIKARAIAGSIDAGERFLETLQPFVWRRHLDFHAIHEAQSMRRRIRDHKGLHGKEIEGHNVKLGPGGIREIEFFAQTRQLIAGGRDESLRQRGTVAALNALAGAEWITGEEAQTLAQDYAELREVEHRLQMIADAQTHSLPKSPEGFDRLARLSGAADTNAYRDRLGALFAKVHAATESFFLPGASRAEMPDLSDTARDIVDRWPGYPALRSERGQEIFARLKPDLLARLMQSPRPDEALSNFDGFLRGLPAGVQLFALFEANPALVDLIVDISATTPALSRYLSRHAEVLDSVLAGEFFAPWPGAAALTASLTGIVSDADYETALDAARRWQKDWHFRIGVHLLRGLIGAEAAARQYSDLAEACVAALWPRVQADIAGRHGPAPGKGGAVIAMGSLGSHSMAAGSDLDLLVVYDADGAEASAGPRPIDPRAWYAKATKALVAALSAPTAAGTLYEVDMRLRPSGRQGPVATGIAAFEAYQRDEAWTWEHLALTRARVVAAPDALCERIENIRRAVLAEPRDGAAICKDTGEMRAKLAEAGRTGDAFDVKVGPGGAQDIALLAQTGALIAGDPGRGLGPQLEAAERAGLISGEQARVLAKHAALFEAIRQATLLLSDKPLSEADIGIGGREFLARMAGVSDWGSLRSLSDLAREEARSIIDQILKEPESP